MTEIEKGEDAAARAPKPKTNADNTGTPSDKQDAKGSGDTKDDGRSIAVDDMNSANDE